MGKNYKKKIPNFYHIINKMPNQSWNQWLDKINHKDIVSVPWNWKYDVARRKMNTLWKTKYFEKKSFGGIDFYERTDKINNLIN